MAASIALLCFLLILHQSSSLVSATVAATCKTVAAGRGESFSYEWCVATLSSYPGSASADTQGLAVIATELTLAQAKSVQSTISNLLKSPPDPKTKSCLDDCSSIYSGLVGDCQQAITALTSKRYADSRTHLSAAYDASDKCEARFNESKVKPLLIKENTDSGQLADLAFDIANLLNG